MKKQLIEGILFMILWVFFAWFSLTITALI